MYNVNTKFYLWLYPSDQKDIDKVVYDSSWLPEWIGTTGLGGYVAYVAFPNKWTIENIFFFISNSSFWDHVYRPHTLRLCNISMDITYSPDTKW